MMRIFIADDEEIIRDGIRNCIEKEKERFLFVGEASDGEMALPMLMEMKPDVLIADICMPFMDGLELAKLVRRAMPWMRIIFLSGHDEFEYAQQAVSIRADAYLLKPIDSLKLVRTLEEVAMRMEQEQRQYFNAAQNASRTEQESEALREHFLNALLSGEISAADAAEQGIQWGLPLAPRQCIVCLMRLEQPGNTVQVRALAARTFENQEGVIWFFRGGERLILLLWGETEEEIRERAYEAAQNLRHEIRQFLNQDTLTAIGMPVGRVSALRESYRTAKEALWSAAACAEGGVFGYTDIKSGKPQKSNFDYFAGSTLQDKLRHITLEDVSQFVDIYFGNTTEQDMQSMLYRYYLLMDLLVTAARVAGELDSGEITAPNDPQAVLQCAATLEGTKEYAAEVLGQLARLCYRHQNIRYSAEIQRAKEFIRANYSDSSLSLHMVAAEVGFSPNHFSTIFSQETGQTFVEYLTQIRLEAAKELLLQSDSRMSDIAFTVGYSEPHYFSYLFKKHVGMTPRDYRARKDKVKV